MNIQKAREIIDPAINKIIDDIDENNVDIKITMLRAIINEAINKKLNLSTDDSINIKNMFSGRGKAWAKIFISEDNPVWNKMESAINDSNEDVFYKTNILDLYNNAGFAWMRFGSSSKGKTTFHLRHMGSKLEDHIKVKIDDHLVNDQYLENLQGVPHNLNLEEGFYSKDNYQKKSFDDNEVSKEELGAFNITSIEDILNS